MFTTTGLIFADWAGQVVPEHTAGVPQRPQWSGG